MTDAERAADLERARARLADLIARKVPGALLAVARHRVAQLEPPAPPPPAAVDTERPTTKARPRKQS